MGMSCLGRRHDFRLCSLRGTIGDILPNGTCLQPGILQHHAIASPQGFSGNLPNIFACGADRAIVHIVKAHQQIDEGGLSAAGRTNDGHPLTGHYLQIQILDQRLLGHIGEIHIQQFHLAHLGRVGNILGVGCFLGLIQQIKDPLGAGDGILQFRHHAADLIEGLGILAGIAQKHAELSHGNAPGAHKQSTHQGHCRIDNIIHKTGTGIGKAGEEGGIQRRFAQPVIHHIKVPQAFRLMAIGLYYPLAFHQLVDEGGLHSPLFGLLLKVLVGTFGDESGDKKGHGCQQHHDGGDPGIQAQHNG